MNDEMSDLVECHSGYDYLSRPIAFYWDGQRVEVESILYEWRSPDHKGYRVRVIDEGVFELSYDLVSDSWEITAM